MAVPSGYTVAVRQVRGSPGDRVEIDWQLLNASGQPVAGRTHHLPAVAPQGSQTWEGDGATQTFTTTSKAYGTENAWAAVGGTAAAPTWSLTAEGTLMATFAAAPAKGATVQVGYDVGPGLNNAAGSLTGVLGLAPSSGTVYSGTVGGMTVATTHAAVADLAQVLFAWAQVTVEAAYFP